MHMNGQQNTLPTLTLGSYFLPCVGRGGYYGAADGRAYVYSSNRYGGGTTNSDSIDGLRPLLYAK